MAGAPSAAREASATLQIVITGRGGQGAQLAGNLLAMAFFAGGREVHCFATYGGTRRGTRLIVLLVPCLDGWGVPEHQGIALARLAVESDVFPLYEVEDGCSYTLNAPQKSRPVRDYLRAQRRYQYLEEREMEALQREVDDGWTRLLRRTRVEAVEYGPRSSFSSTHP